MKNLRPFSVTIGATTLFIAWAWIDMSGMDYRGSVGGRTTAGWFVLGSPLIVIAAFLASMLFSFAARRTWTIVGWTCLLVVFIPLIAVAIEKTTPDARLRTALGIGQPAKTEIHRIAQSDSFGDGLTIYGVCSADRQFVDQLVTAHGLKPSEQEGLFHQLMPEEGIPDDAAVLSGDDLTIYFDQGRSRVLFCRRLGRRSN